MTQIEEMAKNAVAQTNLSSTHKIQMRIIIEELLKEQERRIKSGIKKRMHKFFNKIENLTPEEKKMMQEKFWELI